ncbi:unnamed protein product, partial [Vitis vinifera]|uniref:Uncharacterized protein n=1 Tax=Vitis vinifera TaxID=29760 RepID=D7U0C7_VITVI
MYIFCIDDDLPGTGLLLVLNHMPWLCCIMSSGFFKGPPTAECVFGSLIL